MNAASEGGRPHLSPSTLRQLRRLRVDPNDLGPDGAVLVERRLRMRRQFVIAWTALMAALIVLSFKYLKRPDATHAASVESYALKVCVATGLLALLYLAGLETGRLLDRRAADAHQLRISRGTRASLSDVLGRTRVVGIAIALACSLGLVVAETVVDSDVSRALSWARFIVLGSVLLATLVGVVRQANRPACATDGMSLEIDDRLRAEETYAAAWPVVAVAGLLVGLTPSHPLWIAPVHSFAMLIVLSAYALPRERPPFSEIPPHGVGR